MHRCPLLAIIVAYLSLGVLYSAMSPVFEAPDELQHYGYVRHLLSERRLPPGNDNSVAGHEGSQPPVYYVVAALSTAWRSHEPPLRLEPNTYYGNYQAPGTIDDNKNAFLHSDVERFPWRGTVLTVRITRLVNLLFGALTVGATYLLAQEAFCKDRIFARCAAATVAFTPQFLFISSAINNDVAASAFSTVTLWLLVGGVRREYSRNRAALLGAAIGLAVISKVSALALLPLTLVAVGLETRGRGAALEPSRRLRHVAGLWTIVLVVAFIVGGWWYVRNGLLYADPLGVQTHFQTWWRYEEPLPLLGLRSQLPGVALSFWAAFGMGNVHLPRGAYLFMASVVALALCGLAVWAVQAWRSDKRPGPRAWSLGLLALWTAVLLAALLRWMQLVKAPLGRLLFPAIGAASTLIVWGLAQLVSYGLQWAGGASHRRAHTLRTVLTAYSAVLFAIAAAAPFLTIGPAYARPALLSRQKIDARAQPTEIEFGDSIRLLGYQLGHREAHPGEAVPVTLCWEGVKTMEKEYAYFVHLLGPGNAIVGSRNTYPGLGRFPTNQWAPGDSFCDVVRVPVRDDIPVQVMYDVEIGWYDPEADQRLQARNSADNPLDLVLLDRIRITPETTPTVAVPHVVNANLGDRVTLLGYDLSAAGIEHSDVVTVTLYWKAQTSMQGDYTVFVHLATDGASPSAQSDSQPRGGSYPTSVWDPGEVVVDQHVLQLPGDLLSGEYQLLAGMYHPDTGERLVCLMPNRRVERTYVPLETLVIESGVR